MKQEVSLEENKRMRLKQLIKRYEEEMVSQKERQKQLVQLIAEEKKNIVELENSLPSQNSFSIVDSDIRNSKVVTNADL